MNKKIFGIKVIYLIIGLIILISIIFLSVIRNKSILSEWEPTNNIIGVWSTKAEIFADFKKNKYPSKNPNDWFDLKIQIHKNGNVTGNMGNAVLKNCKIKLNRNSFEKAINVKTDYIISNGFLDGYISPNDSINKRNISIPFNLKNNTLKGCVFHLEGMKYPYPIFPKMVLIKIN